MLNEVITLSVCLHTLGVIGIDFLICVKFHFLHSAPSSFKDGPVSGTVNNPRISPVPSNEAGVSASHHPLKNIVRASFSHSSTCLNN